jgi:hypothetical protein
MIRTFCNKTIEVEDNKVNLEITRFIKHIEKSLNEFDKINEPDKFQFKKWLATIGTKKLLRIYNFEHFNDKTLNEEENNLKNVYIFDLLDDAQFLLNQIDCSLAKQISSEDKELIAKRFSLIINRVESLI